MHLLGIAEFIDAATPERGVVLGRPTLFRQVQQLLTDQRIVVDAIAHPAGYADPVGSARIVAPGWPDLRELPDPAWAAQWRAANRRAGDAIDASLAKLDINASPRLARDLVAALPSRATLVLGSSQAPRDVALTAAARDGVRVVANRGVAGIDGTVSTAVGVALTADNGPTVALLGDLTFLHDITGLLIGPHEPRPDLTIVVSNNDGGAIFGTLESGRPAHSRAFERVFGTPHGALLAGLAESFGAEHILVSTADELPDALADPSGMRVIEVPTSRTELPATLGRFKAAVRAAL
jgi:2-succinyl-5-enolpyruvyl-6-hydroxy-3-cyclohexene-1-carboxylate synthase